MPDCLYLFVDDVEIGCLDEVKACKIIDVNALLRTARAGFDVIRR